MDQTEDAAGECRRQLTGQPEGRAIIYAAERGLQSASLFAIMQTEIIFENRSS